MVITDHGSAQHAKIGVEKVNPDIVDARAAVPDTLVFQGLEWNIPAAEHGTVFVHPGKNEVAVLKAFENNYDGVVTGTTASSAANEAVAISGLQFLSLAVQNRDVQDALMFANHPARKGIDSPHEIRGWRDAEPRIAVGFEGAPGHQAAGIAAPDRSGRRPRLLRQQPVVGQLRRLPARQLPHLRRLRLDDGDGRRALGQPARRGQAVVDHGQLRQPPDLGRHLGARRRAATSRRTASTTTRSTPPHRSWPTATSGPATTAARTSAPRTSPTPR